MFVADVSIASDLSGAERVLYEQSVRLARRGYGVVVLTRLLPGHDALDEMINGVHEFRYRVRYNNPVVFMYATMRNGARLFNSLQQRYEFQCIHFHQPFSAAAVCLSPMAAGIRKIYTCHSLAYEEYLSRKAPFAGYSRSLIHRMHIFGRKWIEKRVLMRSHQIVALSRYTREKLISFHGIPAEKINIISGGVDLSRFFPVADKSAVRRQLGVPLDRLVLLTVRNLDARMGLENLIHAMALVKKSLPDICLVIGGSGPLSDRLKDQTRRLGLDQTVFFTGFIPEDQLPDYYRSADLFVLPSEELEGFGLVTIEALASGVPVIGTPIGGTMEILGGFDPHFLFADTTHDAMAALIEEKCRLILEDPAKWAAISSWCRAFAEAHYSWDRNLDALEALMLS